MKIKKILYMYYTDKLEKIREVKPAVFTLDYGHGSQFPSSMVTLGDIVGWLVMAGVIVHYFFSGRFFEIGRFIPGFTILF